MQSEVFKTNYSLMNTAATIWEGIERGLQQKLIEYIVAKYDVNASTIQKSVHDFLRKLVSNKIIVTAQRLTGLSFCLTPCMLLAISCV
jgi:hypothetical protein